MFIVRPFQNPDWWELFRIWDANVYRPSGHFRPMKPEIFEEMVFAFPFYDYRAISVAIEHGRIIGFSHACFGPNQARSDLCTETGHICLVAVLPEVSDRVAVCRELILASEQYLRQGGATTIYGGSPRPAAPFYHGYYGGAEPIGVSENDDYLISTYESLGFIRDETTVRYSVNLQQYTIPFTPGTLNWNNDILRLDPNNEPPVGKDLWSNLLFIRGRWMQFKLSFRESKQMVARLYICVNAGADDTIEKGVGAINQEASLYGIQVHNKYRQQGLAAYLLVETLRYLINQTRIRHVTAQVYKDRKDDKILSNLFVSLHWQQVDNGIVFKR